MLCWPTSVYANTAVHVSVCPTHARTVSKPMNELGSFWHRSYTRVTLHCVKGNRGSSMNKGRLVSFGRNFVPDKIRRRRQLSHFILSVYFIFLLKTIHSQQSQTVAYVHAELGSKATKHRQLPTSCRTDDPCQFITLSIHLRVQRYGRDIADICFIQYAALAYLRLTICQPNEIKFKR